MDRGSRIRASRARGHVGRARRFALAALGRNGRGEEAHVGPVPMPPASEPGGPRVLVVAHHVPAPNRDGGSVRVHTLIEALLELGCRVTFFPHDLVRPQPHTAQLQQAGVAVLGDELTFEEHLAALGDELDLAILCQPFVAAAHLHELREYAPAASIAYDTADLHFLREQRRAALGVEHAAAKAATLRELELGLVRACDMTILVSEEERQILRKEVPAAQLSVVPVVGEIAGAVPPVADRSGVLFVGSMGHAPNADAVHHLVEAVMPIVWRELGELNVFVVGPDVPPDIQALASPQVHVTGWVEDLQPLIDGTRLMAAPLRFGAGMKVKVAHSLGAGLPVVTTSVGAEGFDVQDGAGMLIADDAEGLAQRIVRLSRDDDLWRRLSVDGQDVARRVASRKVMRQGLAEVLAANR